MKINPDKCVACGNCTYVCPMGAIYIDPVDQARDGESAPSAWSAMPVSTG